MSQTTRFAAVAGVVVAAAVVIGPTIGTAGASPDASIGTALEVKAAKAAKTDVAKPKPTTTVMKAKKKMSKKKLKQYRRTVRANTDIRVGSFNILTFMPNNKAKKDLFKGVKKMDIVGIQEWPSHRAPIANKLRAKGWGFYKAQGDDPAVAWRKNQYKAVKKETVTLVGPEAVGFHRAKPGIRTSATASKAAVVTLKQRSTGKKIVLISVHYPAHIEKNGKKWPGATAQRMKNHRKNQRKGAQLAAHYRDTVTRNVFLTGDMNVDYAADKRVKNKSFSHYNLKMQNNFKAMWDGVGPNRPTHDTNRNIDYVWAPFRADDAWTRTGKYHSDHRPVVAWYRLR